MTESGSSPGSNPATGKSPQPEFSFRYGAEGIAILAMKGAWTKEHSLFPGVVRGLNDFCRTTLVERLQFDTQELFAWDSRLITVLLRLEEVCHKRGIVFDLTGLPSGAMRLVDLATARPPEEQVGKREQSGFVQEIFRHGVFALVKDALYFLEFLGRSARASARFVMGMGSFRKRDFGVLIRECGVEALSIIALVNLLVGLILAFVGAVQLKQFGAQIYVANLITISMIREMGAFMTGIIMAGRTGAAYAAHLGTMNLNEEIDALNTLGLSPMEFLVAPRIVALVLMMPVLCLYADFMGMLGGLTVAVGMLDIPFIQFVDQAELAFSTVDLGIGLFKSVLFGFLVGLIGCFRGMQSERNAAAVGFAATSAVVTATVAIIATDGILAVLCDIVGI
ncbi:MAG: ABC transporter permease [Desulfohalobiaceae bacterium]|nr:ABC transporter permease [Desulfohalobiaceae bacterium]